MLLIVVGILYYKGYKSAEEKYQAEIKFIGELATIFSFFWFIRPTMSLSSI